ncbi:MAG: precorrin-8X methylmutase [Aphanocapsa sp. GSE-SYN-MK-11-07L]|jgi:precorrin-8X/cobalt-precorrin-8 methylmutase|nr:precorrin-8X methylmutase [Aphanocapsa sp. GSE-SYN-MK-11-07L]
MESPSSDAERLSLIDREIGQHKLSPAEYEIVRRVIDATADLEYKTLIRFSAQALQAGAAALAARTTIVVDGAMVQAGVLPTLQRTFANPVYGSLPSLSHGSDRLEELANRYPEAIFVIGETPAALATLLKLIASEVISPALMIYTPAAWLPQDTPKTELKQSWIPHIYSSSRKGNPIVAVAVLNALADLAWNAYGQK